MDGKINPTLVELADRVEALGETVQLLGEVMTDYEVRATERQLQIMDLLEKIGTHVGLMEKMRSDDERLADAAQAVLDNGLGSLSYLLHKTDIAYVRAQQLLDLLEAQRLLGDVPAARKIVSITTEPVG